MYLAHNKFNVLIKKTIDCLMKKSNGPNSSVNQLESIDWLFHSEQVFV